MQLFDGQLQIAPEPGSPVLDQHVGALQQREEDLLSVRGAEIEGDPALVGVQRQEEDALFRVGLIVQEGATTASLVTAARRLYLDHIGAEVRQDLPAERSAGERRKLQHAYPGEQIEWHQASGFDCAAGTEAASARTGGT